MRKQGHTFQTKEQDENPRGKKKKPKHLNETEISNLPHKKFK